MEKKYIVTLVLAIFVASGLFYKQLFKTQSVQQVSRTQNGTNESHIVTNAKNILDLSNQNLEKLPSYVLGLSNLEELNISNNKITGALPAEIHDLSSLRILNAS